MAKGDMTPGSPSAGVPGASSTGKGDAPGPDTPGGGLAASAGSAASAAPAAPSGGAGARRPEGYNAGGNIIRPRSFTAPPPDPAEALYYEGMAAYQHRNWPQALERFSKLKELQPGRPGLDALLDEVRWFMQLQAAVPSAVALPETPAGRIPAATPNNPWRTAGIALLALIAIAALVLVAFNGRLPWTATANREAQDLYDRAETRLAVGDYEGAQAVYRKLLELYPGDPEAQLGLDRAQRQQILAQGYAAAQAAILEEDWQQAAIELANLLAVDPNYADAQARADFVAQRQRLTSLYDEGSRLYDLGQWEDAAGQFERIREIDDSYREEAVSEFLFVCYLNSGEKAIAAARADVFAVQAAVDYYALALSIHPRNRIASDAHRQAGIYLLAVRGLTEGNGAQAETHLRALVAENSTFADGEAARQLYALILRSAQAAEAAGDYPSAVTLYDKAQDVPGVDTSVAAERSQAIASFTPTPSPTATLTATATRTLAPSATPQPGAVLKAGPVSLRGGPGASYPVVGEVPAGAEMKITGRRADNLWYRVETATGQTGWLAAPQLDLRGDVASVAVVTPPPPPASPTRAPRATPTPELVACVTGYVRDAAGGVPLPSWVVTLTGENGQSRATRTNFTGSYRFAGLVPGVYTVALTLQGGWAPISPTGQTVTVSQSPACAGVDFWLQRGDTGGVPPTPAR